MPPFWGYHLMLDCGALACGEDAMNDVAHLRRFVDDMLAASGMTAWGEPLIARLTDADGEFPDHLSGYTVVQLLHTSSMTMHLCDKVRTAYIDLFSCKMFDNDKVIDVVKKYLAPGTVRVSYLTRQA